MKTEPYGWLACLFLFVNGSTDLCWASAKVTGDLMQWHKVTIEVNGPESKETDTAPNPFTDYRMTVRFVHESGAPEYQVPGYFAADGDAANSSAAAGNKWRAHLSPDKPGQWSYQVSFLHGNWIAVEDSQAKPVQGADGSNGSFQVVPGNKQGNDFRSKGRLQYTGGHYLRFAGSRDYFLKAGPDSPETLLAYADFDGTGARKENVPLKRWSPHVQDWEQGNPTWKNGKGKGLIGALNYLASQGMNTISFLPYNAGGDGDNIWPFIARDDKFHYDCSKLDQWGIVFDHATTKGIHLHFKLQENEMDDDRLGDKRANQRVPESLDGGKLGRERKLYLREMVARFAHSLALNWNLGEENTQSTEEIQQMAEYLHKIDPYKHNIVIHTFPQQQDEVYTPLLGEKSLITGASLQNHWDQTHARTLKWVLESRKAGRPWVVPNDEQGPANLGVPPDPGFKGQDGVALEKKDGSKSYTLHDIRKLTLWGNLMAGGAGVEYYFGYELPENDLLCEDFRSREQSWRYCRIALDFFRENKIPLETMRNENALVGNRSNDNSSFCLANPGGIYLVYLPKGGSAELDLTEIRNSNRELQVKWFNPRAGGDLKDGSVKGVRFGAKRNIGEPPGDTGEDWLAVIR